MNDLQEKDPEIIEGNVDFFELLKKPQPLHRDLRPHLFNGRAFGKVLKHPLVFGIPYLESWNPMYNQQYLHKKKALEDARQNKKWSSYIFLHERPYRINALSDIAHEMTDQEYWEMLGSVWSDSENLWQYKHYLAWLLNAKREHKEFMMDEEERAFYAKLPDQFIIYRGHHVHNRTGYSWTLSYGKAWWFANRFAANNKRLGVVSGTVEKKDICAVLLGRNEFEVVVDPRFVKFTKGVRRTTRRPDWIQSVLDEAWEGFALHKVASDHGLYHWEKVEKNAAILARNTPGADPLVARLFALVHDSKRENEMDDPEHGHRSAAWCKVLHQQGRLRISDKQLDVLVEACAYHNDGQVSDDPTIGVCWDADRLDLSRVGIAPDPELLSTEIGKQLVWKI